MPSATGTKINRLLQAWPRCTVATQVWLTAQGISSNLARWYVSAGWLARLGPCAFLQAGDEVDWRGGLYALQSQLAMTAHVGARTALDLQELAHFVPLGSTRLSIDLGFPRTRGDSRYHATMLLLNTAVPPYTRG